jgi:hypothetical protein
MKGWICFLSAAFLAAAVSGLAQTNAPPPPANVAPDWELRERQRVILTEMISLNSTIRTLRDQALKQDEYTRREWAAGKLTDAQIEAKIAHNNTNLPPMQKRWKELEAEYNKLQEQIKAMAKKEEGDRKAAVSGKPE